ncbi:SDR family oxidoreductase [Phascolarctobacterium sp. ET69]|uniref:SDR family oxidoreductase n=1 Tax=Phascolarctobacterium sp. ET69 TaxID=2939420 RepID=UPI0020135BFC|nr:SDR family oxidoreductase [Phascolarctobacterium sp. ET69]MCL1604590.1 SDR family oxidoreductase [Phascolarctobacterium sp. ET69]
MKWIIVTGDSGGLGSAIVKNILNDGKYGVIGISRSLNENIMNLMKDNQNYVHINFDLENSLEIRELYKNKIKTLGEIVGLVNNSAMAYDDIITNANVNRIEKMFSINVYSPMILTKYVIRDMLLHNNKGSIVHISSVSAHTGYKGLSMYAATKGALEAFSKNVAREWGVKGIRSNCVAPGFMETTISSSLTNEQRQKIYQRTSLKMATDIESVASMVVFLLSEEAKSITGSIINIDSGTI